MEDKDRTEKEKGLCPNCLKNEKDGCRCDNCGHTGCK